MEFVKNYHGGIDLQATVAGLAAKVEKLESDFASHFHGADELLEVTDPPIVPVEPVEVVEPLPAEAPVDEAAEATQA